MDVLLLDKTGTITLGNRQAVELVPVDGTGIMDLAETAQIRPPSRTRPRKGAVSSC